MRPPAIVLMFTNQTIDPEGFLWHNLACSVFNIKGDDGNE
jgi:hypothetical protein